MLEHFSWTAIARQTVDRYLATQMPDGGFPSQTDPDLASVRKARAAA